MDFTDLDDQIAAVAHRCWCKRMLDDGWRFGKLRDPVSKTHDCIRPYRELSPMDRAQVSGWVAAMHELEEQLADRVQEALCERELSAKDIYVGMRVRMEGEEAGEIGRIVAWKVADAESGRLEEIEVEWPTEGIIAYCPAEHAIVPADDA